jgi:3-hydroxyacyl-CoA dehydrogenase
MTTETSQSVRYERVGPVGLIELDNPPVNATSHHLRAGLHDAVLALAADPQVSAIAIYGAARAFIAGADIREFGQPRRDPMLVDVCQVIEACRKPVISVLHGPTLGGGLEVAIATHARIALPDLVTGFPEVTLGILPGAGGTQRAPRLIGVAATLDLATTGRRIGADEALRIGLVDRIDLGSPRAVALAAAGDVIAGALATRRTGELPVAPDPDAVELVETRLAQTSAHLFAPHKVVQAVASSSEPLKIGLARERALFDACLASTQRAGLIHAFFAERAVAKIPEAGVAPRAVTSVGIVGGGTMGSGIATACLLAGLPVVLAEQDRPALDRARAAITGNLAGAVKRGKLSDTDRDDILARRLTMVTDLSGFDQVDLAIEAVFEDMEAKLEVFRRLDAVCGPGAILATNTSYLDVNRIAAATRRPHDVLGLHFFSPAHVMRLLEVVVAGKTAPDAVTTGFALAKRLGKCAVRAGVCDGFIGNRILAHYRKAAEYMVLDGASPEQLDRALRAFGMAMGPFEVSDLAGLDIGWATRKRQAATRDPKERYVAIADRICERGWFGRKTGRGYYLYGDGPPRPNPDVDAIIAAERARTGTAPRRFTDAEIADRYITAMISEAARVLEDGIALRPIDVDAVFLFGYGFPRHLGGPMHHADTVGAAALVDRIEGYATGDPFYWQVPPLVRRMAGTGATFADMNKET